MLQKNESYHAIGAIVIKVKWSLTPADTLLVVCIIELVKGLIIVYVTWLFLLPIVGTLVLSHIIKMRSCYFKYLMIMRPFSSMTVQEVPVATPLFSGMRYRFGNVKLAKTNMANIL